MSKSELITAILQINRTAAPEFLQRFREPELEAYLKRVKVVNSPRPARKPAAMAAARA